MADWRPQLWGIYNELATWALIFMAVAGVYLWLASRPKFVWGQLAFAGGILCFLALWLLSR